MTAVDVVAVICWSVVVIEKDGGFDVAGGVIFSIENQEGARPTRTVSLVEVGVGHQMLCDSFFKNESVSGVQ